MKIIYNILLLLVAININRSSAIPDKIVCYFGSWATYREGDGKFNVEDINPGLCTHLIYSFVGINHDGSIRILDRWNEIDLAAIKRFNNLKNINKDLKTLIAIGGWNEGSLNFSVVAADPLLTENFAKSSLQFIESHGFDGFDLDWEYPSQRGGSSADKVNFGILVKKFRELFDANRRGYLLTAAVAATASAADISYDVPTLSQNLDFINIMAYDYHGFYDKVTGQNAPLYPSSIDTTINSRERNVKSSINAWILRGAAPEKLVLGMPVYGRTFRLSNVNNNALGSPCSGPGNPGPYTKEGGILGYNEICELQSEGWTEVWDDQQKAPYMYKGDQWVGFDNVESIQEKVIFAKSKNLGGVMIWSIETDDFRGKCGPKYPILNAINQALTGTTPDAPQKPDKTTTKQPPSNDTTCKKEGYIRDANDCQVFYYCQRTSAGFNQLKFKCAGDLVFDTAKNVCNYRSEVTC